GAPHFNQEWIAGHKRLLTMSKHEITMELRITRFECQPEEITEELGIQPRKIWRKGEPLNDKGVLRNKQNGWGVGSGLDKHSSFEEHTEALLNIIEPKLEAFTRICNQYRTELS